MQYTGMLVGGWGEIVAWTGDDKRDFGEGGYHSKANEISTRSAEKLCRSEKARFRIYSWRFGVREDFSTKKRSPIRKEGKVITEIRWTIPDT